MAELMSPDVIAIVAVGVSLAALIVTGQRSLAARMDARMDRLEAAIHSLGVRVARLEGAFPFLTARLPESGGPHQPSA